MTKYIEKTCMRKTCNNAFMALVSEEPMLCYECRKNSQSEALLVNARRELAKNRGRPVQESRMAHRARDDG